LTSAAYLLNMPPHKRLILCPLLIVTGFGTHPEHFPSYAPGGQEGMEAVTLAEYYPEEGFGLPAHVLVTDAQGKGVHMVLNPDGWSFADLN
jgi:hypothetical protein